MEAHPKMACLKAIIMNIFLVGLGECARDLTKCVVCKLDLDNSARICSACRISLTSLKYKQSAETFDNVSKHFQFHLF